MSGEGNSANDGDTSAAGGAATGLTEARVLELIKTAGGKAINVAIGERLKGFESKMTKSLEEFTGKFTEGLEETLGTILSNKLEQMGVKPPKADGTAQGGSPDEEAIKNSPFVKGLQKKLDAQEAAQQKLQDERNAERKAARTDKLRASLLTELNSAGLDPKSVADAVDLLLFRERARYQSDESDVIVFKDTKGEDVDLATGVSEWAKSEDGKRYSPPSGANGSGNLPGSRVPANPPASTNGMPDRSALKAGLARAYNGDLT